MGPELQWDRRPLASYSSSSSRRSSVPIFFAANRSTCASVVVVIVVLAQILCANGFKKNELLENFASACLSLVLSFDVLISPQQKRPKRHRNSLVSRQ